MHLIISPSNLYGGTLVALAGITCGLVTDF